MSHIIAGYDIRGRDYSRIINPQLSVFCVKVTKYCTSTTLAKSDCKNSVFLKHVYNVKKLKAREGGDIKVHGSGNLAQTLFKHDLVDELCLTRSTTFN